MLLRLGAASKVDTLALVSCTGLIRRNIVIQLCLLLVDLRLVAVSLCQLNLESEDLQLEFQDLVLDLATPGVSYCGNNIRFSFDTQMNVVCS
jgi:hypothetical protein